MTCDCGMAHVPMEADIEVRDPDDEIVAHRAFVHVERLSPDNVWMSIATPDGRRITVEFHNRKGHRVRMFVDSSGDTPTSILGEPVA